LSELGNPAKSGPAKFLAGFAGFELITDKTSAADLASRVGLFAILVSVSPTIKIQNPLPFHKFRQKLANSDVTKEALNCTASL